MLLLLSTKMNMLVDFLIFSTSELSFFWKLSLTLLNVIDFAINPSKNELGKIIKSIQERVNKAIVKQLKYIQWENTKKVNEWFENITNKQNCACIQFDFKECWSSITEGILDTVITIVKLRRKLRQHWNMQPYPNLKMQIIKTTSDSILMMVW